MNEQNTYDVKIKTDNDCFREIVRDENYKQAVLRVLDDLLEPDDTKITDKIKIKLDIVFDLDRDE